MTWLKTETARKSEIYAALQLKHTLMMTKACAKPVEIMAISSRPRPKMESNKCQNVKGIKSLRVSEGK